MIEMAVQISEERMSHAIKYPGKINTLRRKVKLDKLPYATHKIQDSDYLEGEKGLREMLSRSSM